MIEVPPPLNHFVRPDYTGGGLLNLMASLADALGAPTVYPPLAHRFGIDAADLRDYRRIVLIVVDGMGDALVNESATPHLHAHRVGRLTSVFPSTTASAVTALLTALAPAQHGLTGWHMWFAEIDRILSVLPLLPRARAPGEARAAPTAPEKLFTHEPLSARSRRKCFSLAPQDIVDSPFNLYHTRGATCSAYPALPEFFQALTLSLAGSGAQPSYTYAYLPDLDHLMHEVGPQDPAVRVMLGRIDRGFGALLGRLKGGDTTVIVTADHGFCSAPPEKFIELDNQPELAAMLTRPLCGERRVAFAYVKPERRGDFLALMAERFADACTVIPTADFIAEGWFGPATSALKAHPQLASRAGDYVLLMHENWTIKDWMPGERRHVQLGVHGGASADEMWTPLIVARP
jgi:hypothetical protein